MLWLTILLLVVFFAGIAMTVNEGLWSNAVSLFCVILAAGIGWDWGRVLGRYVIEQVQPAPDKHWFFWFACIWGVFAFSVTVFRVVADRSSRVRMRFIKPLEVSGGLIAGLGVAIMFTSFAAYTLYIPFKAGEWKVQEAAGWQQQTIAQFASPMFAVGKAMYGDEFPDLTR
jgi:hypothetical protein